MSMQITHPQNVFKKREKVNMSDDLVKQLRFTADDVCRCGTSVCLEAADRIEKLERDILNYSSAVADAQMRNEELDRALNRIIDRWEAQKARIEKLEAALREIVGALDDPKGGQHVYDMRNASYIARKALDGKDV